MKVYWAKHESRLAPSEYMEWHTLHSKPTLVWRLWLNTTGCFTRAGCGSDLSTARDQPVAAARMLRRRAARTISNRILAFDHQVATSKPSLKVGLHRFPTLLWQRIGYQAVTVGLI